MTSPSYAKSPKSSPSSVLVAAEDDDDEAGPAAEEEGAGLGFADLGAARPPPPLLDACLRLGVLWGVTAKVSFSPCASLKVDPASSVEVELVASPADDEAAELEEGAASGTSSGAAWRRQRVTWSWIASRKPPAPSLPLSRKPSPSCAVPPPLRRTRKMK